MAEEDILSAINYIANALKVPIAANNLLDEIEKYEKTLENMPNIFPFVSDEYLASKRLKFVMIKNYTMFYTIDEDKKR